MVNSDSVQKHSTGDKLLGAFLLVVVLAVVVGGVRNWQEGQEQAVQSDCSKQIFWPTLGLMARAEIELQGIDEVEDVQRYIERHMDICVQEGESPEFSALAVAESLGQITRLSTVDPLPEDCEIPGAGPPQSEWLAIGGVLMTVEQIECIHTSSDIRLLAEQGLRRDAFQRSRNRTFGDLDCDDIGGPVPIFGSDPHRLDADNDGIGCE